MTGALRKETMHVEIMRDCLILGSPMLLVEFLSLKEQRTVHTDEKSSSQEFREQ